MGTINMLTSEVTENNIKLLFFYIKRYIINNQVILEA